MKKWIEFAVSLLFIHKCFLCGRVLPSTGFTCRDCALPATKAEELCPFCGKRTGECVCALLGPERYDYAAAPLYYTDQAAHGIHKFKYSGRTYYADFLAPLMYAQALASWPGVTFDGVAWVPMHPKKQRARGFCQSELLARRIAKQMGVPLCGDLIRNTGRGRAQMEQKGNQARKENAGLSYEAVPGARTDKKALLLVDDVLTTGWTGARCGALLHELGAEKVYLLTAATTYERKKRG